MTAEQLEELLGKVTDSKANHYRINEHQSYYDLLEIAPSLARRVIAAEKLVSLLGGVIEDLVQRDLPSTRETNDLYDALTAYREASK